MGLYRASGHVVIDCGKRLPFGQPVLAILISRHLVTISSLLISCHHRPLFPLFDASLLSFCFCLVEFDESSDEVITMAFIPE